MSLSLYNKKRNFSDTPEPEGKENSSSKGLRFVIQKHDASSLHYDFRLEMNGVLKSWAVPKGPSLNPEDKRLAMMVEDHPYDYRNFEGVIPEGNYGAGTVIVWDEGTYEPLGARQMTREEQQKTLLRQLHMGNLKFVMHGKKLNGEFTLFRLKKGGEKSWLLIKKGDIYATADDVKRKDKSVKSGKSLAQVAAENGVAVKHEEEEVRSSKTPAKKAATKKAPVKTIESKSIKQRVVKSTKKGNVDVKKLLQNSFSLAVEMPMPQDIKPMLATLVDEPFDDDEWLFEIKWDGYRALSYMDEDYFDVLSRNNISFIERYPEVTGALESLGIRAVFDGEIVAVNEEGLANFQLLQNWLNTKVGALHYYIFDVIWLEGHDLTRLPLVERKRVLSQLLPKEHPVLKYSDHVLATGKEFFNVALKGGLEGIMAKKVSSKYELGNRTDTWLKIKVAQRQEVIIAGYTQPRKTRKFFGALLLGVYKDDELIYVGHTGSGFNKKSLEQIYKKLQPLVIKSSPFARPPKTNMPATWVKPELICEIKFTEWTKDLQARHPIFMGLREDKKAADVTVEKSAIMSSIIKGTAKAPAKKTAATAKKTTSSAKEVTTKASGVKKDLATKDLVDVKNGTEQTIVIKKQELTFTNINKLYWKKEGITKGDMINYYAKVAPYMLTYMKDRPQSMHRHPNGVGGTHFFQKDMRGKLPGWIGKHESFSESTNETIEYLVCKDEASLLYMANLGCIEMHPWHSRYQQPDNPDYCLIDLDPDTSNTYDQVMKVALLVKALLDEVKAPCYPKTSGSTGMHIYIPLGAKYDFDQSKQLAELIVTIINQQMPGITSIERNPDKRKGKIYLDYLQNRESQTAAAPYSLRPKPGAPVSTPLDWSELKKGKLQAGTYTMHNIFDRLKRTGDLFKPVLGKGIDLEKVLKKIENII